MTESTIDIDRAMQGIDCEVITWTKCSERMPAIKDVVIVKSENSTEIFQYSGLRLRVYFSSFTDTWCKVKALSNTSWAPYTPEAWAKLNKNIS